MWRVKPKNKYGSRRTVVDGIKFDSLAEAKRYRELKLLKPEQFEIHPRYPIMIRGIKVCDVVLDFQYYLNGDMHYEDVKGVDNAMSRLKRRLVEASYGFKVEVIKTK